MTTARLHTRSLLLSVLTLLLGACGGSRTVQRVSPTPIEDPSLLIRSYYDRVNHEDLDGVLSLLSDEPSLNEPFSTPGRSTTHQGYFPVAHWFERGFRFRNDQIVPEFVSVQNGGAEVSVGWSLHGEDGTSASGNTVFTVRNGRIQTLDIRTRD